jgi:hypothetical protein
MSEIMVNSSQMGRTWATAALAAAIGSAVFLLGAWITAPSQASDIFSVYWGYVWLGLKGCAALIFLSVALAVYLINEGNRISIGFHACDGRGATTPQDKTKKQN